MIFIGVCLLICSVFLGVPAFVWWFDLIKRREEA